MYNKKLIYDYVVGNDIIEYDIDTLENDSVFMRQVIDYTNDKNMYNLCSEKVKNNYDFIKYIINKFKDDSKFIINVADDYIKNNQTQDFEPNCVELKIIMSDIGKKKNEDEFFVYTLSTMAFQEYTLTQISLVEDKIPKEELRLGFYIIQNMYYNNPLIVEYFAKKFIKEIFYENEDYTFEELIHKDVREFKMVEKTGIINYLISYISKYDSDLSAYLQCHIELLNREKYKIQNIRDNWSNFMNEQSMMKYELFESEITSEYLKQSIKSSFLVSQLIEYVIKKLNIDKRYKLIEEYLKKINDDGQLQYDFSIFDKEKLNFIDRKFLEFAMNRANEIFSRDVISIKEYTKEDYEESSDKEQPKIFKLKFNNEEK